MPGPTPIHDVTAQIRSLLDALDAHADNIALGQWTFPEQVEPVDVSEDTTYDQQSIPPTDEPTTPTRRSRTADA